MVTSADCIEYLPVARLNQEEIRYQVELLSKTPLMSRLFDIIPDTILILNEQRQIVYANLAALSTLKATSREDIYGLRPGEALHCIHAEETDDGCGTANFCRNCGAVKAIISAFKSVQAVEDYYVTPTKDTLPLDFRITASPYFFLDERFVVFVISDISDEKRREMLERIFFHDVNNTLSALLASVEMMPPHATQLENDLAQGITAGVYTLLNEIETQQSLLCAEDGNLALFPEQLNTCELLQDVIALYAHYECAHSRNIKIETGTQEISFTCDKSQLSRVIGNMLKNALEASLTEDTITIGSEPVNNDQIRFWVHNPQHIRKDVRDKIFSRSFSTKGTGRGVGTYSIKLIGERYLNGSVNFTSSTDTGTTFSIIIPRQMTTCRRKQET